MNTTSVKLKILFLCTGNACRSQMAEGWTRALKGDLIQPFSAGIEKHGLDSQAVAVMKEAGVDISRQQSKTVEELGPLKFDVVVTVCADADGKCPAFSGTPRVIHVGFDDPPRMSRGAATQQEAVGHYRRVRDQIQAFVRTLPGGLDA